MSEKLWGVITYQDQERRKRGHLVRPKFFRAETRKGAKLQFLEQYPNWRLCQLVAHPMKEEGYSGE